MKSMQMFTPTLGTGHSLVDAKVERHEALTFPPFLDHQSAEDYLVTMHFMHPGYTDGQIEVSA